MKTSELCFELSIVCAAAAFLPSPVRAVDLSGVWANDTAVCNKVFSSKGGKTSFQRNSDIHGSGFIIEGNRIRGRSATCKVTRTTEGSDGIVHMLASCATDIMLSNVQLSVKVLEEGKINRIFPGMEGMEMTFHRCPPFTEKR